jgi:hypothetical protein
MNNPAYNNNDGTTASNNNNTSLRASFATVDQTDRRRSRGPRPRLSPEAEAHTGVSIHHELNSFIAGNLGSASIAGRQVLQ